MANDWQNNFMPGMVNGVFQNSPSYRALSTSYVYGSAGAATACEFLRPAAKTLSGIYAFLYSFTGDKANVNDLNWELRTGATQAGLPGATLLTSGAYDPSALTPPCWIPLVTGLTQAIAAQTTHHLVLGDADGNGTDYATVVWGSGTQNTRWPMGGSDTTAGWTAVSNSRNPCGVVLAFSDDTYFGAPFSAITIPAASTNERGLKFQFTEDVQLGGLAWNGTSATTMGYVSQVNLYSDPSVPGSGQVLAEATTATSGRLAGLHVFTAPVTLTGGNVYRATFNFSASTNGCPYLWYMGEASPPAAVAALQLMGNANWCYTEAVAGSWVDTATKLPQLGLGLYEFPAVASVSGMFPIFGSGGMD